MKRLRRLTRKTCPLTGGSWFVGPRNAWEQEGRAPDEYVRPVRSNKARRDEQRRVAARSEAPTPTLRLEMDDPERAQLYAEVRAVGYCARCGSQRRLTVDHIVPLHMGGGNHRDNLQCLCKPCNVAKGLTIWAPQVRRAA